MPRLVGVRSAPGSVLTARLMAFKLQVHHGSVPKRRQAPTASSRSLGIKLIIYASFRKGDHGVFERSACCWNLLNKLTLTSLTLQWTSCSSRLLNFAMLLPPLCNQVSGRVHQTAINVHSDDALGTEIQCRGNGHESWTTFWKDHIVQQRDRESCDVSNAICGLRRLCLRDLENQEEAPQRPSNMISSMLSFYQVSPRFQIKGVSSSSFLRGCLLPQILRDWKVLQAGSMRSFEAG